MRAAPAIAVNKAHFPVTTLGFGRRVGIWLQGCSIRCRGCISPETWEVRPGHYLSVAALVRLVRSWLEEADGVTISGGEPFDQPEALDALITALRRQHHGDLLVFSGYSHRRLQARHADLLERLDVLVSGPYRPSAGQTLCLRGSDNQRVHLLSHLARQRYPADMDRQPWPVGRRLDVAVQDGTIWMAGIPAPAEMECLQAALARRGYQGTWPAGKHPLIRA